jgi:hypothetical protein
MGACYSASYKYQFISYSYTAEWETYVRIQRTSLATKDITTKIFGESPFFSTTTKQIYDSSHENLVLLLFLALKREFTEANTRNEKTPHIRPLF